MVATWLVKASHDAVSIAWYMSAIAAFSFLVCLTLTETHAAPLQE